MEYFYPASGEPKTVHYDITGKRPQREEIDRLTGIVFPRKPVSPSESKRATGRFFAGLGTSAISLAFGLAIIYSDFNLKGLGALMAFLTAWGLILISTPLFLLYAIYSLSELFRSGRKKTAEKSFLWVWQISLLGESAVTAEEHRFSPIAYALDTLERAVPDNIDRAAAEEYITRLRKSMAEAMDRTTAEERAQGLTPGRALIAINIEKVTELYPNVSELAATIRYSDVLEGKNAKNENIGYITAMINLHVSQVYIKAGDYWYPYDLSPVFGEREE
jgi:hypothetical protein